ncbi:MAG: Hsp20/alpha crystallin family protein [Verrucomicrobiota bacterium]
MTFLRNYSYPLNSFASLDRFFGRSFPELGFTNPPVNSRALLATNVYEDDHSFHVRVEVPGAKKDQIDLQLEDEKLAIAYAGKTGQENAKREVRHRRTVALPGVNPTGEIKAQLENGILTVTLPKTEEAKPRQIQIS